MASVSRRQCLMATVSLAGGLLAAACDIGGAPTPQEGATSPPTPRPLPKPAEAPAATKQVGHAASVYRTWFGSRCTKAFGIGEGQRTAFESKHPHIEVEWQRLPPPLLPASRQKRPSVN